MLLRTTCGQDADTAYFSRTISKFQMSVTTTLNREARQMKSELVELHVPGGDVASGNAGADAPAWLKTRGYTPTIAGGAGR